MKNKPHSIVRILSKKGVCSRKQAVDLVKQGKISIGGRMITDPGYKTTEGARILIDGKPPQEKIFKYITLNKPAGCVTTRSDEKERETVYEYLKGIDSWVFPVGRLDKESEGLLLFTNDAAFGDKLTDPRYQVERAYEVMIDGILSDDDTHRIKAGIDIGRGETTGPAHIKILQRSGSITTLEITLTEGKNREIRRLFETLGKPVKRLLRTRFGPYRLGDLKPGEWKYVERV